MRPTITGICLAVFAFVLVLPAESRGRGATGQAGVFDYYILALSWLPSWCAATGDSRGDARCAPGTGRGFVLHGLWPQHEAGWPEYCTTPHRDPRPAETARMSDITGTSGLAWHQWNRHGRCSGHSAVRYFALMRRVLEQFRLPPPPNAGGPVSLQSVVRSVQTANPGLSERAFVLTCRAGRIEELRICLRRDDLSPRPCAADVRARACRARFADLPPRR